MGDVGDSGKIRIGAQGTQTATYMAGISGVAVAGDPVVVSSNGQLGIGTSSKRFKDEIKPMGDASEAILALKPVTFRYKDDLDPKRLTRFGLVAEEVEKINPDLVAYDAKGDVYTVRYEAVNAMLLNEFLKEHRTVKEQKATIAQLKQDFQSKLAEQQKQIQTLTAGLQKVNAQIERGEAIPNVVAIIHKTVPDRENNERKLTYEKSKRHTHNNSVCTRLLFTSAESGGGRSAARRRLSWGQHGRGRHRSCFNLSSGVWNTAVGRQALRGNTTGGANTATGFQALLNNITGERNSAYGSQSLNRNSAGSDNIAIGVGALYFNQSVQQYGYR